ncbi:MAG: nitroreductase family protein [Candidatus Omnitrophica bacterium]|nr:nitroreductase family protein [Candidatus Omnitrophota bacterium]MBU4149053.1 nitroreductase family protein [Candidatus Omnitrophota bacterium]
MEFFDVIKNRKSVREYSDKKIDRGLIEKIIDAGRMAATARNEQPWEFIATSDKEAMKKICSMCPNGPFIKDASYLLAVFSKDTKYYLEDCSAATQNILLAIEALGLGGCWIAGDKKDYAETVGNILNAPEGHRLVSMISVGYPKKLQGPKAKRPLKEVLHWEKW